MHLLRTYKILIGMILKTLIKGLPALPFKFTASFIRDNLSNTGRTRKQILSFAIDAGLVAFCVWAAFSLRLGQPYTNLTNIWHLMLLLPPITVFIFAGLGVYRWVVRASSSREYEQLLKGGLVSSMILLLVLYLFPITFAPRSVFLIYGVLLVLSVISARVTWARIHNSDAEKSGKPIAIYGAGAAGRQLVSLMRLSNEYHPEFFLDDSYALIGSTIAGLPVFNPKDPSVSNHLKTYAVEEIVLALPSTTGDRYSQLLLSVEQFGLPIKTTPPITEIISGRSSPDEIRGIKLEDLLGREQVEPDVELLSKNITGKTVLVTGAGGSIGSELCRQIALLKPIRLIMFDNSEPSLYHIDQELAETIEANGLSLDLVPALGSVTDVARLEQIFNKYKPVTVYHAAAYKHVPMVEANPFEGVQTNVFGTRNTAEIAEKYNAEAFVFISTDKAVRPTNIMGATKRISEIVINTIAEKEGQKTKFSMVRFGNVLGSSGSVIPKFQKQIENGGPVTVTHKEMTRYFMMIPEAVSLVIQAGAMSEGGEVYLLDMGVPVKVWDLACAMVRLKGKSVKILDDGVINKSEILVKETGIRPGEKLFEELLIALDKTEATAHAKIFKANESQRLAVIELGVKFTELQKAYSNYNEQDLLRLLNSYELGFHREIDLA